MKSRRTLVLSAMALILALSVGTASAFPVLELTDTIDNVTVQVIGSSSVVSYFGPVGSHWTTNLTGGFSPFPGPGIPRIDLLTGNATGNSGGTLLVHLYDTILGTWSGPGAQVSVGGTFGDASSSASFNTFVSGQLGSSLSASGSNGLPFALSDTINLADVPTGGTLVDLYADLTHLGASMTTLDYQVSPVPEPGTLMLLGSAFMFIAVYAKRRSHRQSELA